MSPNHNLRLIHFIQNGAFDIPNWTSVGAVIGRPTKKAKKGDQWSPLRKFLSYATVFSASLFLSTKIFQFSTTFRKAPPEGSCRHCRLRGGSLLNFNHTNGRPMVAPTHVPLKQQRTPIIQMGDQWSPLHTFHSNNSELQSRKQATNGRHYTRSTQTTANSNHASGRPPVATPKFS